MYIFRPLHFEFKKKPKLFSFFFLCLFFISLFKYFFGKWIPSTRLCFFFLLFLNFVNTSIELNVESNKPHILRCAINRTQHMIRVHDVIKTVFFFLSGVYSLPFRSKQRVCCCRSNERKSANKGVK